MTKLKLTVNVLWDYVNIQVLIYDVEEGWGTVSSHMRSNISSLYSLLTTIFVSQNNGWVLSMLYLFSFNLLFYCFAGKAYNGWFHYDNLPHIVCPNVLNELCHYLRVIIKKKVQ